MQTGHLKRQEAIKISTYHAQAARQTVDCIFFVDILLSLVSRIGSDRQGNVDANY